MLRALLRSRLHHRYHVDQRLRRRLSFQTDTQDEFAAEIERHTARKVVAFMSANQTTPGIACELFFLDARPLTGGAS